VRKARSKASVFEAGVESLIILRAFLHGGIYKQQCEQVTVLACRSNRSVAEQ